MIKYLITDPKYYSHDLETFKQKLSQMSNYDFILYRDKANPNYRNFAKIFSDILVERGVTSFFIHRDPLLAKSLNAFGVHLSSDQQDQIKRSKDLDLFTIVSCHSIDEIEACKNLGADAITISPIFISEKGGEPIGIEQLQIIINKFKELKIFALGGVKSQVEVDKLQKINGVFGFASIRFFV